MKNILLVAIILISVIVAGGCVQTPKSIKEANICGDDICGATEDCNTCSKDCSCDVNKYCDSMGICRIPVCGDSVCSKIENQSQTCCDDCGCTTNNVCNKVTGTCQSKSNITDDVLKVVATEYMKAKNISGNITTILDAYYKNQTVKQVNINCKIADMPYPCMIYLYIDASGKILDSAMTT